MPDRDATVLAFDELLETAADTERLADSGQMSGPTRVMMLGHVESIRGPIRESGYNPDEVHVQDPLSPRPMCRACGNELPCEYVGRLPAAREIPRLA